MERAGSSTPRFVRHARPHIEMRSCQGCNLAGDVDGTGGVAQVRSQRRRTESVRTDHARNRAAHLQNAPNEQNARMRRARERVVAGRRATDVQGHRTDVSVQGIVQATRVEQGVVTMRARQPFGFTRVNGLVTRPCVSAPNGRAERDLLPRNCRMGGGPNEPAMLNARRRDGGPMMASFPSR